MYTLCTAIAFIAFTLCANTSAQAQARKSSLPIDTGILNVSPQIVPHDGQPETGIASNAAVFVCYFPPQPEFPGGNNAMYKFIEANLRVPSQAKKAGISGRVFVSFNIETTGDITHVTVLKGLGFGCDVEAVRLIQSMPKWIPGKQDGKPVRVKYCLPILFRTR